MEPAERIITKAHEMFMRWGIRSVSMDQIAAALGISKKTIYQYYPDKDALVEGVVEIEIQKNEGCCKSNLEISENPVHEILLDLHMVQAMLSNMNPYVVFDMEKYHPKAAKKFHDHKYEFIYQIIKSNLERGMEEGLYRKGLDVEVLAKFRLASMFLIFNPDFFPFNMSNPATIITVITDNFLHGITTPKGQELINKYQQP